MNLMLKDIFPTQHANHDSCERKLKRPQHTFLERHVGHLSQLQMPSSWNHLQVQQKSRKKKKKPGGRRSKRDHRPTNRSRQRPLWPEHPSTTAGVGHIYYDQITLFLLNTRGPNQCSVLNTWATICNCILMPRNCGISSTVAYALWIFHKMETS